MVRGRTRAGEGRGTRGRGAERLEILIFNTGIQGR